MFNGVAQIYLYTDPHGDDLDGYTSTGSLAFQLRTGDRVQVGKCHYPEHVYNSTMTHFSGMLVRPNV